MSLSVPFTSIFFFYFTSLFFINSVNTLALKILLHHILWVLNAQLVRRREMVTQRMMTSGVFSGAASLTCIESLLGHRGGISFSTSPWDPLEKELDLPYLWILASWLTTDAQQMFIKWLISKPYSCCCMKKSIPGKTVFLMVIVPKAWGLVLVANAE